MTDLPRNPLVPAYKLAGAGQQAVQIIFRCPGCGDVHAHGIGDGSPIQWRAAHCMPKTRLAGRNVRLMICGTVSGPHMLPRSGAMDIAVLSSALTERLHPEADSDDGGTLPQSEAPAIAPTA